MLMISADVLALSSEAAVLVRSGRIQFANSAAKAILGEGCVGSTVKSVFGVEIAEAQAASFGKAEQIQCVLPNVQMGKKSDLSP